MRASLNSTFTFCLLASFMTVVNGWTSRTGNAMSRQDALATLGSSMAALLISPPAFAEKLPSGVTYEVIKNGDGPKPEIGELIAIRFAAFCGSNKIDDIFDTPEPYYTRLGSGGLLKGVESTLPLMRLGDRWKLEIPVSSLLDFVLRIALFSQFLICYSDRVSWHLVVRAALRLRVSLEFRQTPPSPLRLRWLDFQERSPNSLN